MTKPIVPREIRKVFQGRIFSVQIETITLPKGGEMKAEIVRHPGSVVIVPVTDAGEIILVRQYRPAIGRWAWELPAGTLKDGEDPQRAALRECHEEIGLITARLERLGSCFPTPGYCDEEMHFFRAAGLRPPGAGDEAAQPDEDEDIEPRAFSIERLKAMIKSGEIVDLKTVAGLSLFEAAATPPSHGGTETRRAL
ncbi:MAG TPA: NUDIX hydrolase [Vicinamibacterales bacterium]